MRTLCRVITRGRWGPTQYVIGPGEDRLAGSVAEDRNEDPRHDNRDHKGTQTTQLVREEDEHGDSRFYDPSATSSIYL